MDLIFVHVCSCKLVHLTHCVPYVDIILASPVIALRERLSIREYVAFYLVYTLSKAVVIQPGSPVIHIARAHLTISCSQEKKGKQKHVLF